MKQAILQTLSYYNHHSFPLTLEEVCKFYSGPTKVSKEAIKQTLGSLVETKQVGFFDGFYFLLGGKHFVEIRKHKIKVSKSKLKKAKIIAKVLGLFIPWIQFVGVTGSLALEASDVEDDLDLMFITSSNRLWITRGIVVTVLLLTGQYRRKNKIKDRICPNIFVDIEGLEWPRDKQIKRNAHEFAHIGPLLNKNQTYERFLDTNQWVNRHLPNFNLGIVPKIGFIPNLQRNHRLQFFQWLEHTAMNLQVRYMKKKITAETVTRHRAFFHPDPEGLASLTQEH